MNTAIAIATVVLVGITGFYAWETREMVNEMREARGAQVLPHVVPTLGYFAPLFGFLRIQNVGSGPAVDVNVRVQLDDGAVFAKPWRAGFLVPGEFHDLLPPDDSSGELLRLDPLTATFQFLRVIGTCRDALGREHTIDAACDSREMWTATREANVRLPDESIPKRLEKIEKAIRDHSKASERAIAKMLNPGLRGA